MCKKLSILQQVVENKVIAVIRGETMEEANKIVGGAYAGGIKVMEITYTVPNATLLIQNLQKQKDKQWFIGAGTVLDEVTARIAILAGAHFIVSPHFNKEIAKLCNRYQIPYIPGCFTTSEVVEAMEYGSDIIKIFPGNQVNPSIIKAIKGPLEHVNLMPSGGVNVDNIADWFDNGAVVVSVGSNIYKETHEEIKEAVRDIVKVINDR